MNVQVVLVVAATDHKNPCNSKFLFYELGGRLSLPLALPAQTECGQSAVELMGKMTGVFPSLEKGCGWAYMKQEALIDDISREPRVLVIPYSCIIPEPVKLCVAGAVWATALDVLSEGEARFEKGHREILVRVLGRAQ